MSSFPGKGMQGYLMSAQGHVDNFFMAQDAWARVGPNMMRAEAKGMRWEDADAIARREELKAAMKTGDPVQINQAYAAIGMAGMFEQGPPPAPPAPPAPVEAKVEPLAPQAEAMIEKLYTKIMEMEQTIANLSK